MHLARQGRHLERFLTRPPTRLGRGMADWNDTGSDAQRTDADQQHCQQRVGQRPEGDGHERDQQEADDQRR